MSGKIQNVCQKCGKLEQLRPAGISKKTNKPYEAFYGCGTKDCWKTPGQPSNSVPMANSSDSGQLDRIEAILHDLLIMVESLTSKELKSEDPF